MQKIPMHPEIEKEKNRFDLEEFLKLPEELNGYCHLELLEGEILVMPKPTPVHNRIVKRLLLLIEPYLTQRALGGCFQDTLVILDPEASVALAPDLCYFAQGTLTVSPDDRALRGIPELVVEVLSPSTRAYDRGAKLQLYHRYRVPWVWLLSPDPPELEEYCWSEKGYQLRQHATPESSFTPALFPDLSFSVDELVR